MLDNAQLLWFYPVMAGLRSSLGPLSELLEIMTADGLYERQRALVRLGALKQLPGRGPGSGVPFTAQNFAILLISVLTVRSLSEMDDGYVVEMCDAQPEATLPRGAPRVIWQKLGRPTFASDFGRVLSGQNTVWRHHESRSRHFYGVRVTDPWRAQIIDSPSGANPITYFPHDADKYMVRKQLSFTAEIGDMLLENLIALTKLFLSTDSKMVEDDR